MNFREYNFDKFTGIYTGDLTIENNKTDIDIAKQLTYVIGSLYIGKNVAISFPKLVKVKDDILGAKGCRFPQLVGMLETEMKPLAERQALLKRVAKAALATPKSLEMGDVHVCNSTHCISGWAIHLSGRRGYDLEDQFDFDGAGQILLGPEYRYIFTTSNAEGKKFLKRHLPKELL